MNFKQFLSTIELVEEYEEFLHHIAEEELIACKVHHIKFGGGKKVHIIADCNDKPRRRGYQADLSKKLKERLVNHYRFDKLDPMVFHENLTSDHFQTIPSTPHK